jgi:predicted ATPase
VLMERRRLLHERAGVAIEELFKGRIDDHLAELAHHYSRSTNTRKAVEYLFRAGDQALARSSYSAAITRLSSALEFLKHLPNDAERARGELKVQSRLLPSIARPKAGRHRNWNLCMRERASCARKSTTQRSLSPSFLNNG